MWSRLQSLKSLKIASGEIGQGPISSLCHGLCQTRPLMILPNTRVDYALTPPLALSTLQSKTEQLTELNKTKRRVCVRERNDDDAVKILSATKSLHVWQIQSSSPSLLIFLAFIYLLFLVTPPFFSEKSNPE